MAKKSNAARGAKRVAVGRKVAKVLSKHSGAKHRGIVQGKAQARKADLATSKQAARLMVTGTIETNRAKRASSGGAKRPVKGRRQK